MIENYSSYINENQYRPASPLEALAIRFCKQKCKKNNCSFFSRRDNNGNVWHFSGYNSEDYYYAFINQKLVRKKVANFFQDSFEEISDSSTLF